MATCAPADPHVAGAANENGQKPSVGPPATRLILKSGLCPGDVVVMTAAVRELHRQYPRRYQTDVRTSTPAIWENNPHVTAIADGDRQARVLEMHYPLINQSNQRPVHFIEGYCEFLATQLGLPSLRPREFRGDIHLTDEERGWMNQVEETTGYGGRFWLINAGSKRDFTCKQWPLENFQAVVDHFHDSSRHTPCAVRPDSSRHAPPRRCLEGTSPTTTDDPESSRHTPCAVRLEGSSPTPCAVRPDSSRHTPCAVSPSDSSAQTPSTVRPRIQFVQIGAAEHNHPPLEHVIDLRGKTDHRQLIRLVYHAAGVLTGVSYPMHLAAAVPNPPWLRGLRPCVVINGGREPAHWEQYPGHQLLHTIGALDCCATGGCWKSRVVALGDGDHKDRDLCPQPVGGHPRCMWMITPEDVIRAIERYAAPDNDAQAPENATQSV